MRIVHVANFYGPNSGGIKTTMHELGRGYLAQGHEFIFIVPGTRLFTEQTIFGKKITVPSIILPGSCGYQLIRNNRALVKLIARLEPDRIEVSDRFTLHCIGRWAKRNSIPTVAFSHETLEGLAKRFLPLPEAVRRMLVGFHNKKFARNFNQIIATTNFAAREFIALKTKNLIKVPLGVDLKVFNPNKRSEELRTELLKGSEILLVHCGRLSKEKEPQRSVEALIELRARGIDARLVIVGMGPMWKEIRTLAKGHPIDTLGYIADRNKVAAILASADVSLAPGPLETFCLAALESLASGTPVVTSNSNAVGEFLIQGLKDPAGATAHDNYDSIADAIERVIRKQKIRLRAREVAEEMTWDNTVNRMLEAHGILKVRNTLNLPKAS
jgi:alpha-1,6-mannosyltransferase